MTDFSLTDFFIRGSWGNFGAESIRQQLAEVVSGVTYQKLPRHVRSHSKNLPDGSFLHIKGAEILKPNFERYLAELDKRMYRSSGHSYLYHFSHYEEKVPAILKLSEASLEAEIAHLLQTRHQKITGRSLRIPRPQFLLSGGEKLKKYLEEKLALHVDPLMLKRMRGLIESEGVAIYCYHHESGPHRLDDYLDKKSWFYLRDSFEKELRLTEAYKSWVYVFLFMLSQDVLPIHEASIGLGSPLDKGNLCLAGGMSDLGTCYFITEETTEAYLMRGLEMAWHSFIDLGEELWGLSETESKRLIRETGEGLLLESSHLACALNARFLHLA